LPANAGHRAGAQTLRKLVPEVEKMGIKYLTVYALSTENWSRPASEVEGLMRLLREYLQQYVDDAKKNNMRMSVIGDITRLEPDLQRTIIELSEVTSQKRGMHVQIALNYGGRDEIVRAVRRLAHRVREEALPPDAIDENLFSQYLDTAGIPAPDLLIRTGGEQRLSNFLLWQTAYSEMYPIDILWPDFSIRDLKEALNWYVNIERRFGARV
ncbi:MAG: polyprenyl diphosphate synthase, partial [Defluviitaleaceae bacterium]|nr:polyprenyl diphosphate synthase [Defluviitaleaceae bacterium]